MLKRTIVMVILNCLVVLALVSCGDTSGSDSTDATPTAPSSATASSVPSTPSLTPNPPHLTGVVMSVSPSSFSSVGCGATTNIVFSASLVIAGGSTGGQIAYTWTINNSNIPGSVTFAPGQTSKTVTYTLSNFAVQLSSTSSVRGSITVGKPGSSLVSSPIGPSGHCNLPGPFQVTGIGMSVFPASIAGIVCGTTITVTYTATIYIAPNSNAGTVQLLWTLGAANIRTSAFFDPAQTVQSVSYSLSGTLRRNDINGFPRYGSMASTSPNAVYSGSIRPAGFCL